MVYKSRRRGYDQIVNCIIKEIPKIIDRKTEIGGKGSKKGGIIGSSL